MDIREISTWTALVTPFREDGSVDTASLERLVAEQSAAGNGLVVLGSTGEALACDEDEKFEILKAIMWMDREVPVVVGVGGFQLALPISKSHLSLYLMGPSPHEGALRFGIRFPPAKTSQQVQVWLAQRLGR